MKTAFFALLTVFLLFSCSTDEGQLQLNDELNNTSSRNGNTTSSNKSVKQTPTLLPAEYYTYQVIFNNSLTAEERDAIREEIFPIYKIFTFQISPKNPNIETWYTLENPATQEPSLIGSQEGTDGDFSVGEIGGTAGSGGDSGSGSDSGSDSSSGSNLETGGLGN